MKQIYFQSEAEKYLALRACVIKDIRIPSYTIRKFAKYANKNQRGRIVDRKLVMDFLGTLSCSNQTKYAQLGYIRGFCRYLYQLDKKSYVPEARLLRRTRSQFKPYILNEEEVKSLMHYARNKLWNGPQRLIVPAVYETLVGLLWVTGMRIGEAVNLNLGDVDFTRGTLFIRETKFYKSRLLPITASTLEALKKYIAERNSFNFPKTAESPLFFNWRMRMKKRGRYTSDAFHEKIHEMIVALGIRKKSGQFARPYDLRHSFATHQLSRVYSGKNAVKRLPLIATYMGHAKLTYTQIYLHPSVVLLNKLGNNFLHYFRGDF